MDVAVSGIFLIRLASVAARLTVEVCPQYVIGFRNRRLSIATPKKI
jgi:hypothetical protein